MKKTLFAALALAFVASCSNEEVLDVAQKEAIGFDKVFVDNATRSVSDPSITNSTITNFNVYGFVDKTGVIFNGTKVTGSGVTANDNNANWTYEGTKQYWINDAIYNFCAIAPADVVTATATVSNETTDANNTNNTITTTFGYTNVDESQKDLLYSEATCVEGKTTGNEKVRFTFRHLLSKVKFSFENAYIGNNATIKVTDIKITDAVKNASVSLTKENTTWSSQAESLTLNFGDATEAATDVNTNPTATAYAQGTTYESYNEKLLIPSAEREYTVEFTVELFVSNTSIATYKHTTENNAAAKVKFTPEAGKCYDILAKITNENIDPAGAQEEIQFTVTTVEDWGVGTASEVEVKEPAASN